MASVEYTLDDAGSLDIKMKVIHHQDEGNITTGWEPRLAALLNIILYKCKYNSKQKQPCVLYISFH